MATVNSMWWRSVAVTLMAVSLFPNACYGDDGVSSIVSSSLFDTFLSQRTQSPANGFYTYDNFIGAANSGTYFGTTGDLDTRKREMAAFFANVAHETGYGRYVEETAEDRAGINFCDTSSGVACAAGHEYYGRGPLQLSYNYNYKAAGDAIGFDGINNPEIVATDPSISFRTAVWFWMSTACHDAIVNGQGFGATIRAINGNECGGSSPQAADRISLYQSFCSIFGVDPGTNLNC